MNDPREIDPQLLRRAFSRFLTGVTVVTTRGSDGTLVGFTANSFTSVSLDPPLLLVCPAKALSTLDIFKQADGFAVNILAEGQEDVSNTFAAFHGDRFERTAWSSDAIGNPLITGSAARFSCRREKIIDAGDHVLLLGRIVAFEDDQLAGLGYGPDGYFSLGLERLSADLPKAGSLASAGAIVEHKGRVLLEKTADGYVLPQVDVDSKLGVRRTLQEHFSSQGLDVELTHVYSVFDDRGQACRSTWLLARAEQGLGDRASDFYDLADLGTMSFKYASEKTMLERYVIERTTQVFRLYIGNEESGEVHDMSPSR